MPQQLVERKPPTLRTPPPSPTVARSHAPSTAWHGLATRTPDTTRKASLDARLENDFHRLVAKLDERHYSDDDEALVLDILWRWAREPFRTKTRYLETGKSEFFDELLLRLRRKTKDVGIVATQYTSYYDLLFNHFDRAAEVASLVDRHSLLFKGDHGLNEMSFGSFFWEQVKEGQVRDQIFAYFRGLGQGIWSGAKGTVLMVKTLVTDPAKFWEGIKQLPAGLRTLWSKRAELWQRFASAKPEEQAEMIGRLVGELEFMIATSAAGGAAVRGLEKGSKLGGVAGRAAQVAKTVVDLPGRAAGAVGRGVSRALVMGVKGAAAGAKFAAAGIYRVGRRVLRGTWSVVEEVVRGVKRNGYYFFDRLTGKLQRVPELIARRYVRCSVCRLTDEALGAASAATAAKLRRLTPAARAWLEKAGALTEKNVSSLVRASDETIEAINHFVGAKGFEKVMASWFAGGMMQEGARFVMRYMRELVGAGRGSRVMFEEVLGRGAKGHALRVADVVYDGMIFEFKSVSRLRSGALKQMLTDFVLVGYVMGFDWMRANVRWIFNAGKLSAKGIDKEMLIHSMQQSLDDFLIDLPRDVIDKAKAAIPDIVALG